jgi:hypothetical protein
MAAKRAKELEEKLKNLTPKEREEYKKFQGRITGKIISHSLPTMWLRLLQVNKCLNAVETGPRMNRLKKTELLLMLPNMSALTKWRRTMKRIVSISVTVIKERGSAGWR